MPRKKKTQTPKEEAKVLNDAVFTEYPSMTEQVVEAEVKPTKEKLEKATKNLDPIEKLAFEIKKALEAKESDLNVVYTSQFGKMIRILGNNGMHCFSRVRETKDGFLGEFLSFIPVHHLKTISAIYDTLKVTNKNGTYISPSGIA